MSIKLHQLVSALLPITLLGGCSLIPSSDAILPDKIVEYKRSEQAQRDLEIPPDLTRSSISDELIIPGTSSESANTLSGLQEQERIKGRGSVRQAAVLPDVEDIEVKRDGDQRWLVIKGEPENIWYTALEFWQENGILLIEQDPVIGVMQTDWLENRAGIKSDFITDRVRRVFDGLYSASTQDQYRVRIERGIKAGTSELYLTHRGLQETVIQSGNEVERTVWNPRPTDHDLEAEMLRRLMVYIGVADQGAQSALAASGERQQRSQLNRIRDEVSLQIYSAFDRAWRLTGVALDRVGFAVEDRNRREGIYYVRYNDPLKENQDEGFFAKLAFWRDRDKEIDKESQYQVYLQAEGAETRVVVRNEAGERDNSETAQRILTLIDEQLR